MSAIFKSPYACRIAYLNNIYAIAVVVNYFAKRVMRYRKEERWYGEMPTIGRMTGLGYVGKFDSLLRKSTSETTMHS